MKHIYNVIVTFMIMMLLTAAMLFSTDNGTKMMHDEVAKYIDNPTNKGYNDEVVEIKKVDPLYTIQPEKSI